jgi:hypothetical protein
MRPTATEIVERAMGRKVVAFMSDNHLDPGLSIEVFALEPTKDSTDFAEADANEAGRSVSRHEGLPTNRSASEIPCNFRSFRACTTLAVLLSHTCYGVETTAT